MAKISKRQRKFLKKNVLLNRKKGGHRDGRKEKKDSAGPNNGTAAKPRSPQPPPQEVKTLPDGLDTKAFLQCPWLSLPDDDEDTDHDGDVGKFEPEASLFESTGDKHGLTEHSARGMIDRAVENGSVDDLLWVVGALRMASSESCEGPPNLRPMVSRKPGSKRCRTLALLASESFRRLHLAFQAHLGPRRDPAHTLEEWEEACLSKRQQLERAESWPKLGGASLSFLRSALDSLRRISGSRSQTNLGASSPILEPLDQDQRCCLLQGLKNMRHHVPLLFPFPRLARRYLIFLLGLLERTDEMAVLSVACARLYELSTSQPMPFLHDAFKGVYRSYRAAAATVGTRSRDDVRAGGSSPLPLLREFIAELFGVEKPSAYLHAFVFIHDIVREATEAAAEAQRRGPGKAGDVGPAEKRLRSWDYLQALQLWTCVVAVNIRSLGPLTTPLTKALEISFQLSPGLYGAPRVLALARSTQDLAAAAGVFIPTSPYLLGLLELLHGRRDGEARPAASAQASDSNPSGRCETGDEDGDTRVSMGLGRRGKAEGTGDGSGGAPRRARGSRGADLSVLAGLGKEDLRRDDVRSAVGSGAVNLVAREVMGCYRWSASLPDMCAGMLDRLGRMVDGEASTPDGSSGKSRVRVRWLRTTLEKAAAEALSRRRDGDKHPGDAGPIDTFRKPEEPTARQRLLAYKEACG